MAYFGTILLAAVILLVVILIFRVRKHIKLLGDVKESEKVKILTEKNFKEHTKKGIVLVDFWASWCTPCKMMVPILNDMAEQSEGRYLIAKLNVDEEKRIAAEFKVKNIPTMILLRNGKEIHRFVGVKTKDYLEKELDRRISFSSI